MKSSSLFTFDNSLYFAFKFETDAPLNVKFIIELNPPDVKNADFPTPCPQDSAVVQKSVSWSNTLSGFFDLYSSNAMSASSFHSYL